jgi:hypothetical protein
MRILPNTALLIAFAALPLAAQATVTPQAQPDSKPAILLPDGSTQTTQYDPTQGFPNRKGDLSGMLIVIPAKEMAAFTDTSDDRQIDRVSRAEAGAGLAIKLVFTGVKPDANGVANLTYDLRVTGPDGQLYAKSDYHNLVAAIGQVGPKQAVYDNRAQVIQLQFDPGDAPGSYKIDAVLHDRIAKIDLPMTTSVELLPVHASAVTPVTAPAAPQASPNDASANAAAAPSASTSAVADAPVKAKPKRKKHRKH